MPAIPLFPGICLIAIDIYVSGTEYEYGISSLNYTMSIIIVYIIIIGKQYFDFTANLWA